MIDRSESEAMRNTLLSGDFRTLIWQFSVQMNCQPLSFFKASVLENKRLLSGDRCSLMNIACECSPENPILRVFSRAFRAFFMNSVFLIESKTARLYSFGQTLLVRDELCQHLWLRLCSWFCRRWQSGLRYNPPLGTGHPFISKLFNLEYCSRSATFLWRASFSAFRTRFAADNSSCWDRVDSTTSFRSFRLSSMRPTSVLIAPMSNPVSWSLVCMLMTSRSTNSFNRCLNIASSSSIRLQSSAFVGITRMAK